MEKYQHKNLLPILSAQNHVASSTDPWPPTTCLQGIKANRPNPHPHQPPSEKPNHQLDKRAQPSQPMGTHASIPNSTSSYHTRLAQPPLIIKYDLTRPTAMSFLQHQTTPHHACIHRFSEDPTNHTINTNPTHQHPRYHALQTTPPAMQ